jgi:addiction module RelE/StbE family toxin
MADERHPVFWSQAAKNDLLQIIDYIAEDAPQTAVKILDTLESKTNRLSRFPKSGRIIPELKRHNVYKYRELIHAPWRVFYKIEEKRIFVLAVVDSRRNIEDLLLRRQLR